MPIVLIVDDDTAFRLAVARALRNAGNDVEGAADGREALRLVRSRLPDIVITDMLMPDCDGVELIAVLRRDHPSVRILAVSGRANFGSLNLLELAESVGADATLAKPFDVEDLTYKVSALSRAGP